MKINLEIEKLKEQIIKNNIIKDRLYYIVQKIQKLSIKEKAYRERTKEELADVKRLQEFGLRSLVKKVMGDIEKVLEKERKEYLSSVLKHRAVEEEIAMLEYERELLQNRYRNPKLIEKELSASIKKKEFLLKSYDFGFTKELFKKESELGRYKLLEKKSKAVLDKAMAAIKIVNEINSDLLKVKEWSPSGKSKYASMAKKRYIDIARAKAVQANVRLEEFSEYTQKLFQELETEFDLKVFKDFLDNFYENLLTDYIVQRQLSMSFLQIDKILKDVQLISGMVQQKNEEYQKIVSERQNSLKEFIRDYDINKST